MWPARGRGRRGGGGCKLTIPALLHHHLRHAALAGARRARCRREQFQRATAAVPPAQLLGGHFNGSAARQGPSHHRPDHSGMLRQLLGQRAVPMVQLAPTQLQGHRAAMVRAARRARHRCTIGQVGRAAGRCTCRSMGAGVASGALDAAWVPVWLAGAVRRECTPFAGPG